MSLLTRTTIAFIAIFFGSALGAELGNLLGLGHPDHIQHAQYGGDKMERTFMGYTGLPVGEDALKAAGWHKQSTTCDPMLGFAWTEDRGGATKDTPFKLYTTAGGQPAGVGIIIIGYGGQEPLPGPQKKWATQSPLVEPRNDPETGRSRLGLPVAHIDVAFRSGDIVCSGAKDNSAIGDVLIVNPSDKDPNHSKNLPLKEAHAQSQGWKRGSCFDGMGWHYFFDTSVGSGKLSWQAANLFPVVAMYDKGEINAIFFASTIDQVSIPIFKSNEWEPKSLSDGEMCKNLCDKECTFAGLTSAGPWSTAHVYFKDHSSVTCESNLDCMVAWPTQMSCCPSNVVV